MNWSSGFVLPLAMLVAATSAAAAPSPCRNAESSSPAWKQINAQYGKLAAAMRRKDVDALFALYVLDYQVRMPNGELWSRERSLAHQKNGLAQVSQTHHISNTITSLLDCGDRAVATVLQQWYRT
jgi:ketosteroid isomerase-like protein